MIVVFLVVSYFLFKWKIKIDFDKKKVFFLSFFDFFVVIKKVYNGYLKKDFFFCVKEDNYLV